MKTDPKSVPQPTSVEEYIAIQPPPVQAVLHQVRTAIRKAVPRAEEVISYKMPTYTLNGRPILNFAGWTRHFSLYGATAPVLAEFKDELAPYQIERGTIRFPVSQPVPVKLIERIAKFRAREAASRENPSVRTRS